MGNKITTGLLLLLLILVGGFGYFTYTFQQQMNLMREELNRFQSEQTARTGAVHGELVSLHGALETGLDSLGTEIDKNMAYTAILEDKVDANLAMIDALGEELSDNRDRLEAIKQALADVTEQTGSVINASAVYGKVSPVVVRISNGQLTVGSGFIYGPEGHVLTAHHVIANLDEIYAITSDGRIYRASLVGSCAFSDVAVLKLDEIPGIEPPVMSDSSDIKVGDPVAAIGSPFDLAGSLNTGIVSQVNRFAEINSNGQTHWVSNLIQFDAAVNFGNSGGPLFNSTGGIIGLVIARVEPDRGDGIYYAVSANKVRRVADSIITQGYFEYPWLGVDISDLTPKQVQAMHLESIDGVMVNRVAADSPAAAAGVQTDDIIIAIDGTGVANVAQLTSYLGEYLTPGEPADFTVIRGAAMIDISLEVGLRQ